MEKVTKLNVDYVGLDLESMSASTNYTRWILNKLQPFVGEKLLEVGAGSGSVSKLLLDVFQKDLWIVEPSQQVIKLKENLRENPLFNSQNVFNGFLSDHKDTLKNIGIDSVFYINVLEHIEDDVSEMKTVFDILPTGGHILTLSPSLPFLMSDFDRSIGHYRRYMLNEMKEKMESTGFSIVKAYYMDFLGIIPWYIKYVLLRGNLDPSDAWLYDKLVVPIISRLEPNQILPAGKNILVVGRKD